jgi:predicted nucleic acid-binding protein
LNSLVVDASVGAKWYLPAAEEQHWHAADRIIREWADGSVELAAPDLFWSEMVNVFRTAVRRRGWALAAAAAAVNHALTLNIRTEPSHELLPDAFRIANTCGCTVYEALYVALAHREQITLVTADEKLVRLVAGYFPVRWLGAF